MKVLEGTMLRISRAYGTVLFWTNGRTVVTTEEQAEQILIGLKAIFEEGHDEAFTLDTIAERRHRLPAESPNLTTLIERPKRPITPTLDQI